MKVLICNECASYTSETVEHKNNKFKIISENGNAYSRVKVYIYTKNGELALIANEDDIPGCVYINYATENESRITKNLVNLKMCENYIKAIY